MREHELDNASSQSKRIRLVATYCTKTFIEKQENAEGVYEGDFIEKDVAVKEGETQTTKKKKVKEGKGVQLFANGDLYNGDWLNGKMHG
mmetsp:Transcript_47420/g.34705  ORF Transcript_47420/g.34705 Transcript_47420/m.34705 type:complete len:89 (+) Transcript_47420:104-370(+)